MATLTVTAKGQITLKKELLQHLGVRPGQKLHVDKLPGGSITVRPAETGRSIRDIFGTLRCEGTAPLSIEEIARIAEEGLGRSAVKITADTNVLVRSIVADDVAQAEVAQRTLAAAETIALPLPVLCELVWVLRRGYRQPTDDLVRTLRGLIESPECVMDRPAVEAGIALLEAGGDFADGVIAHGGRALGGETFVSFNKQAVLLLQASGVRADIPD